VAQPSETEGRAIREVWEHYRTAWLRGDRTAVLALFEDEARITPDGLLPIASKAGIQNYWFPQDNSETHLHAFDLEVLSVHVEQDMAFSSQKTFLDWTYLKAGKTMASSQEGLATAILRRQKDGSWKIWRLQWTNYAVKTGATPQLLPPTINSPDPEFATTISPNGRLLSFNRTSHDRSRFFWMISEKNAQGWGTPQLFPHNDTTFMDIDPAFSLDGLSVVFSSNRPIKGREKKDFDLWQSVLKNGKWGAPKRLSGGINTAEDEIYGTLTLDQTLYFSRFSGNKAQIYRSEFRNGSYQTATLVEIPETASISIINPAISPDGLWLVFASGGLAGRGSADLYVTKQISPNRWDTPLNLSRINTSYADFAPSFSPDGKTLFFTSERPGILTDFPKDKRPPGDLYQIPVTELRLDRK